MSPKGTQVKIGELAKATQTQSETIRYYERIGLLPEPARNEGNYRIYGETHFERLSFIRHCRSLDMTLAEVRILLQFKYSPTDNCGEVNTLLDAHIGHVAERIRELQHLERQLHALRKLCREVQDAGHCGILKELTQATRSGPATGGFNAVAHVHGTHYAVQGTRGRQQKIEP